MSDKSTIDFSHYDIGQLLSIKGSIDEQKYPQNFIAFNAELEKRQDEIAPYYETLKSEKIKKKQQFQHFLLKSLAIFQLITGLIIGFIFVNALLNHQGMNAMHFMTASIFTALGISAGVTLFFQAKQWLWLSLLNQCIQLVSVAFKAIMFKFTGLLSLNLFFQLEHSSTFGLQLLFEPGYHLYFLFENHFNPSYISINLLAAFFIVILLREIKSK